MTRSVRDVASEARVSGTWVRILRARGVADDDIIAGTYARGRGGRPKTTAGGRGRGPKISVYLSASERGVVVDAARASGLPISTYVRRRLGLQ